MLPLMSGTQLEKDMNISNNTILVTGGSAGIGLALAEEFLQNDNEVIICGRNVTRLEKAKQKNPKLHTIVCDVSDEKSISEMVDVLNKDYPLLNVLVNNAGIMHIHDVVNQSLSIELQKKEIMTNFYGTVSLCDKLIPKLMNQEKSTILNISSGLAYMPFLAAPVYTATKAAIHSYTQSIRQALKNTSIHVFEALPPMVDTEMSKGLEMKGMVKISPEKLAKIIVKQMSSGKAEIKPGASAMMIRMYKLFPWLINAMMRKMAPAILADMP